MTASEMFKLCLGIHGVTTKWFYRLQFISLEGAEIKEASSELSSADKEVETICDFIINEKDAGLLRELSFVRDDAKGIMDVLLERDNDISPCTLLGSILNCCVRIHNNIRDAALYVGVEMPENKSLDDTKEVHERPQEAVKPSFLSLIQHPDKDKVLHRLHELIDGKGGRDVALVLIKAHRDKLLSDVPKGYQVITEFTIIGSRTTNPDSKWEAIAKHIRKHLKYDKSEKAFENDLEQIVIF